MVNMATLTLSSLAELCTAQQLLELILSRIPIGNESMFEIWAREMLAELRWTLFCNVAAVRPLEVIKCKLLKNSF